MASARVGKRGLFADPERFALVGVWLILIIFFVIKVPDTFPTMANVSNMLGSQAVLLVLALGLSSPCVRTSTTCRWRRS